MSKSEQSDQQKTVQELEAAIKMAPVGALGVQNDGLILCTNELAADASGIPSDKLDGAPLADLVIPEDSSKVTEALENANDELTTVVTRLAAKLKPVELAVRRANDNGSVVSIRDMSAEFGLSAKAAGNLTHDQLTGLPDKYFVLGELAFRLEDAKAKPMAIVSVWIDQLEKLIETHGQSNVDKIISEVADRLTLKLRAPDLLGRMDSSGFMVLLSSDAPTEELTDIGDRLRNEIAFPVNVDGTLISFTASVAIAPLAGNKPSLQRVIGLLESATERALTGEGSRTDIVEI